MAVFRNRNFVKRDYEATNIVAAVALSLDAIKATGNAGDWIMCDPGVLEGLAQLWTQGDVTFYGYL